MKILPIIYAIKTYPSLWTNLFDLGGKLKDNEGKATDTRIFKLKHLLELINGVYSGNEYQNFKQQHKDGIVLMVLPEYYFNELSGALSLNDAKKLINWIKIVIDKRDDLLLIAGTFGFEDAGLVYVMSPVFFACKLIHSRFKLNDKDDSDLILKKKSKDWGFKIERNSKIILHGLDDLESRKKRFQLLDTANQKYDTDFKTNQPLTIQVNNESIDINLEVCADHAMGKILQETPIADIHIIIAAGIQLNPFHLNVKKDGFVILCDGGDGTNKKPCDVYLCTKSGKAKSKFEFMFSQRIERCRIDFEDDKISKKILEIKQKLSNEPNGNFKSVEYEKQIALFKGKYGELGDAEVMKKYVIYNTEDDKKKIEFKIKKIKEEEFNILKALRETNITSEMENLIIERRELHIERQSNNKIYDLTLPETDIVLHDLQINQTRPYKSSPDNFSALSYFSVITIVTSKTVISIQDQLQNINFI